MSDLSLTEEGVTIMDIHSKLSEILPIPEKGSMK